MTLSNDNGEREREGTQLQIRDLKELLTVKQTKDSTCSGGSEKLCKNSNVNGCVGFRSGQDTCAGLSLIHTLETGQILTKHPI